MTAAELKKAERNYQAIRKRYEQVREARNTAVREAIAAGWTHAQIAEVAGLTRARVGQIALGEKR